MSVTDLRWDVSAALRSGYRSSESGNTCRTQEGSATVIILGIILIIIGAVTNIPVVYSIGVILALVGIVLWILGATGRAVGGRNHYF